MTLVRSRRRTAALAVVSICLLVPILYGLGFAWFASGTPLPAHANGRLASWGGSFAFGIVAGMLAFGMGRALVRKAEPLAAAAAAAALVGAVTVGMAIPSQDIPPLLDAAVSSLGVTAGMVAVALPGR